MGMRHAMLCLVAGWACTLSASDPAVTVYNQQFGVVRETVQLNLQEGTNKVSVSDATVHLEPDSVILRDPAGKWGLQILEQNYRADPVSEGLLLSLNEGKTISFLVQRGPDRPPEEVMGKVVRSGYTPHMAGMSRYGEEYYAAQARYSQGQGNAPIIEIEGQLRFGLPGIPQFPSLADDTVLKPTLSWVLNSEKAGQLEAELSYVTGGMSWESSYNLVAPAKGDTLNVVGWVTVDNQSGKTFENAHLKLMAGSVSKLIKQPREMYRYAMAKAEMADGFGGGMPPVSEKSFDEFHLYNVERPTTLHDRETKQVEFVRAENVKSDRFYVYDGVSIDPNRYQGWGTEQYMQNQEYGTQSRSEVWVMREVKNSKENGLGIPLPAGRTRFYLRDDDGQLEFTGENIIKHTPQDETLQVYTGDAFDIVGSRKHTNFTCDYNAHVADETFEIKLRNHKKEAVEIRVPEHLYRGINWEIREPSEPFKKMDAQLIEFRVQIKPDEEKVITYTVHYTW
jgi:hypothetical protein